MKTAKAKVASKKASRIKKVNRVDEESEALVVKAQSQGLNIAKLSDDDIEGMFIEAFDKIGGIYNITEFECQVSREKNKAKVAVTIYSFADSPTLDDFAKNRNKELSRIEAEKEGLGKLSFVLDTKSVIPINSNDYSITYISE